ncbi:tail fiber domain-containing protein [Shinella zoogloeoides]
MVSTPDYPDPNVTAQAQAGMNRDTAITQQQLNMTNQITPTGTLTYQQTGTSSFKDSQGRTVETPTYTATTTLSPEQQAIFEQSQAAQNNLATIANDQSGFLKDYLNKPFEYNNQDAEKWAYDLGAQRLDPRFAQQETALRDRLIAQGIRPGTTAWDREMGNLNQSKNDAYNQLMLNGRQQAYTEALQERNQPINEISALLSGSQVSMPQFQSTPQTGVAGVDYTGLVNNKYQAESQSAAAGMGGLFGLLSAPFQMFKFSDERLKEDIRQVGETDDGTPIYTYRYKGDPTPQMGVMAQDVAEEQPEAVGMHPSGFLMVDYGKVK